MNPIMILLMLIGALILWFLLSFLYKPIGNFVMRIYKEAMGEINKDEENNDLEEK